MCLFCLWTSWGGWCHICDTAMKENVVSPWKHTPQPLGNCFQSVSDIISLRPQFSFCRAHRGDLKDTLCAAWCLIYKQLGNSLKELWNQCLIMETPVPRWCVHNHTQVWTHSCLINAYDAPCRFDYSISKNLPVSSSVTLDLATYISYTHTQTGLFFFLLSSVRFFTPFCPLSSSILSLLPPHPPFIFQFSCPFLSFPACTVQHHVTRTP